MSLFKRVHTVTVPKEFLQKGDPIITLRFSQLNPKKMGKANVADTIAALSRQNEIESSLTDTQRVAWDARQAQPQDAVSAERAQEAAEEPDTFDDFDQHTLIALAHVEHRDEDKEWTELTPAQIDELVCMEWLAGEIYDVSKPKSAKDREKNS